MAVIFKLPDPLEKRINRNFLITSAAIQAARGVATNFLIPSSATEKPIGQSYLDTPVIDNLEFPAGAYTDLEDNTIDYGAVVIDTVIFEVNLVKKIVDTSIQGRDGTVSEYISRGDYIISCRGLISNRDNVFPLEQVQALRQVLEVPQQVPIISLFLNDVFSIEHVILLNSRFRRVGQFLSRVWRRRGSHDGSRQHKIFR